MSSKFDPMHTAPSNAGAATHAVFSMGSFAFGHKLNIIVGAVVSVPTLFHLRISDAF